MNDATLIGNVGKRFAETDDVNLKNDNTGYRRDGWGCLRTPDTDRALIAVAEGVVNFVVRTVVTKESMNTPRTVLDDVSMSHFDIQRRRQVQEGNNQRKVFCVLVLHACEVRATSLNGR